MKLQAFLPLVTYPDPVSAHVGSNAAIVAAQLDAELHALAVNVDIPPVSNALSKLLVMDGCGHTRMRDFIHGGAWRFSGWPHQAMQVR